MSMTYLRNAGLNYKQFSAHQGQVENRPFGDAEKGQKGKSWRNFIVYILFITSTPVVLFHNHFKYPTYNLLQHFVYHESSLIHDIALLLASKFENASYLVFRTVFTFLLYFIAFGYIKISFLLGTIRCLLLLISHLPI